MIPGNLTTDSLEPCSGACIHGDCSKRGRRAQYPLFGVPNDALAAGLEAPSHALVCERCAVEARQTDAVQVQKGSIP